MKRKPLVYFASGCILVLLTSLFFIIYCPWINEDIAKTKAISLFQNKWENSSDGCYLDCENCGAVTVKKRAYGQLVTLQYRCGWEGDVVSLKTSQIFVNFLGKAEIKNHSNRGEQP